MANFTKKKCIFGFKIVVFSDNWKYFCHDARRVWEHGIENLNLKFQSRWRIHPQAAQARCIDYREFRYCVIFCLFVFFFFSYYEPFKEFLCEIQYDLCTELGLPVIQPILYSFIVFNKGCRVLDLVHTPHNIFIDPPPSLLPPPPFSSCAALWRFDCPYRLKKSIFHGSLFWHLYQVFGPW